MSQKLAFRQPPKKINANDHFRLKWKSQQLWNKLRPEWVSEHSHRPISEQACVRSLPVPGGIPNAPPSKLVRWLRRSHVPMGTPTKWLTTRIAITLTPQTRGATWTRQMVRTVEKSLSHRCASPHHWSVPFFMTTDYPWVPTQYYGGEGSVQLSVLSRIVWN